MEADRTCYLCKSVEIERYDGKCRDFPEIPILRCRQCGLVFLSTFDHIHGDFYTEGGLYQVPEVIKVAAEHERDELRRIDYCRWLVTGKSLLDFGCGNAGFLLRARDYADSVCGLEPDMTFRPVFEQERLEVYRSLEEIEEGRIFDLITLFHVLEHLPDPIGTLSELKAFLAPGGSILVEVPSCDDALLTLYRNQGYSEFLLGCHLYLFSPDTLAEVCRRAGYTVDQIDQVQRYPLSNHLHWLAKNRPGGHMIWSFMDSPELEQGYADRLAALGHCDTLMARVTLVEK